MALVGYSEQKFAAPSEAAGREPDTVGVQDFDGDRVDSGTRAGLNVHGQSRWAGRFLKHDLGFRRNPPKIDTLVGFDLVPTHTQPEPRSRRCDIVRFQRAQSVRRDGGKTFGGENLQEMAVAKSQQFVDAGAHWYVAGDVVSIDAVDFSGLQVAFRKELH